MARIQASFTPEAPPRTAGSLVGVAAVRGAGSLTTGDGLRASFTFIGTIEAAAGDDALLLSSGDRLLLSGDAQSNGDHLLLEGDF